MMKLDHITIIAPTLAEGVTHVRECLDLDVPFGTRHDYMGTHNHRLQLGSSRYLEIVARDPDGGDPGRARWFGLSDQARVRRDWDVGRRLRGWVARTDTMAALIAAHPKVFGTEVALPPDNPEFAFSIPDDGSLPLNGIAPSLIDHRGNPTSMNDIPDMSAHLRSFSIGHPDPGGVEALYLALSILDAPSVIRDPQICYRAQIETPTGMKELT